MGAKVEESDRVRIAGTLEYMPELRFTSRGDAVCSFDLRLDSRPVLRCNAWEALGEELADLGLQPGTRVGCFGRLSSREYNGKMYKEFTVREYAHA
jgi:single-stranded DNA-binding protein